MWTGSTAVRRRAGRLAALQITPFVTRFVIGCYELFATEGSSLNFTWAVNSVFSEKCDWGRPRSRRTACRTVTQWQRELVHTPEPRASLSAKVSSAEWCSTAGMREIIRVTIMQTLQCCGHVERTGNVKSDAEWTKLLQILYEQIIRLWKSKLKRNYYRKLYSGGSCGADGN